MKVLSIIPLKPSVLCLSALIMMKEGKAAVVMGVSEVYAHNEATNFEGRLNDVHIGSGMNSLGFDGSPTWPTGQGDPSTWTVTSNAYQSEWQSRNLLDPSESPTNGKIGWIVLDLGEVTTLSELYVWHIRENSNRVATEYNIYVAEAPTTGLTHGPTSNSSSIDYDFSSGGWSQIGGTQTGTFRGSDTISLANSAGRWVGLEILNNGGDIDRVGFAEIAVTAVPEPSSLIFTMLGSLCLFVRSKK